MKNIANVRCVLVMSALIIVPIESLSDVAPRVESFDRIDGPYMSNFDFLDGVWDVESRSLRQRMSDEKVWLVNNMVTEYRILLGGIVAINDTYGTFNGNDMHGIMIRTYDPDRNEWFFQWMSRGYPHLTEQVRGRFNNGVGVFYGQETSDGRAFKMRFRWKMISKDHAYWEQAYQDPDSGNWEVNWTLDLTRKGKRVDDDLGSTPESSLNEVRNENIQTVVATTGLVTGLGADRARCISSDVYVGEYLRQNQRLLWRKAFFPHSRGPNS